MIHLQVHLQIPCYDFCFLQMTRFEAIQYQIIPPEREKPNKPPCYSLSHPIGNSDGRCVQRPETYSTQVDDLHLLGIPHSRQIITIVYPQHSSISEISRTSRPRCNHDPQTLRQGDKTIDTKNFLVKTVQRASGPEHLRASRTFYRLKLPLVKTPSSHFKNVQYLAVPFRVGKKPTRHVFTTSLSHPGGYPGTNQKGSNLRSRWLSKLMSDFTVPTSQRPCTTFDNHRIKKELQSVFPHGVRIW